jgi:hypothetical protein
MSDEDEAALHPWKATSIAFSIVWLTVTAYTYFRVDHHNPVVSGLIGACFGLLVALGILWQIGQLRRWPAWINGRQGQVLRSPLSLTALWPGVGLGIVLWGLASGRFQLALVGLPLIALGCVWYFIKRSVHQ